MGLVALALAFVAGLLTALSPCVLPLLPLVMGSAARNRYGPAALAAGFVTTFTVLGVLLASLGTALGLSDTIVRNISAALLVAAGVLMISHRLQDATGRWLSPLASACAKVSARTDQGVGAQFFIGALLGGVWSPCVGPTLGAALGLATRSDTLAHAAAIMAAFGLGSATLLLAAGYASRAVIGQRLRLLQAGESGRLVFGIVLLLVGASVASGADKVIESVVLARLPHWWIDLLAGA
ncbi:MAG TPA: cytochrome c biogenesis protein CcdA [Steroidobacteraceae bacterium]|nr:cytochrome c biogenesis protein CcdA [Steroidobacteraceae bacterium]